MSDYPMLISNKLHSFRNFWKQIYENLSTYQNFCPHFVHIFCFYLRLLDMGDANIQSPLFY